MHTYSRSIEPQGRDRLVCKCTFRNVVPHIIKRVRERSRIVRVNVQEYVQLTAKLCVQVWCEFEVLNVKYTVRQ